MPGLRHNGSIPNDYVTKKIVLKFNICNTADTTVSVYFCPGFYFKNIQLYKIVQENIITIPSVLPNIPDSIGYRTITLARHDSATIIAELSFVKTYNNVVKPRLIHSEHLSSFIASVKSSYTQTDLITYVFCGLLIMMMLFSLTNFLQGANRDFFSLNREI